MQLKTESLSQRDLYQWMVTLITPRPIAWVSTVSIDGVANLAPYSFFNGVGVNPPTLMFCPNNQRDGRPKDTLANIQRTGQFVVNLVTGKLAEAMNQTAAELSPDVDEFDFASLDKEPSALVDPPRVADCTAAFECELMQVLQLGTGPGGANLVVGRIVALQIADRVLSDGALAEPIDTVGRLGGDDYVRTNERFTMKRPR